MSLRTRFKDTLMWSLIIASLALMIYNTTRNSKGVAPSPSEPEIQVETNLTGLQSKDSNGKEFVLPSNARYLLSFLTIECGPCQRQIEYLNREVETGRYDKVIGIFYESKWKLIDFQSHHHPKFLCLLRGVDRSSLSLSLTTFPQTAEVKDGKVTRVWVGVQEAFD